MSEENWNDNENNSFSGSLDPTSVHSQQEMGRDANPGFGQDISEPEPMPSTDNMYRFQNVNVHSENQNKKEPKNSGGIKQQWGRKYRIRGHGSGFRGDGGIRNGSGIWGCVCDC